MKILHLSRRLTLRVYRITHHLVRGLGVLVALAVISFLFLRVYGVPKPLLREAMRRVNAAGIPVEVEGITLTLKGWRADEVRYYSTNPDDLEPLLKFEHIYFSTRGIDPAGAEAIGRTLAIKAVGIRMNPSVEWGIAIPAESASRRMEKMEIGVQFLPDRIVLSKGRLAWLGSQFHLNGTFLKGLKMGGERPDKKQKTLVPKRITEPQYQQVENRLRMLTLPQGAEVKIDFLIDANAYSKTWIGLSLHAEDIAVRGVGFSELTLRGSYLYPTLRLEDLKVSKGDQSVRLDGTYNLASQEAEVSLKNTITSNRPLILLPSWIHDMTAKADLRIKYLPRVDLTFGPAKTKDLLNELSGQFSIQEISYQGFEIASLEGHVRRKNNRIEFTELDGVIDGQEERAAAVGSAMHGGFAKGSAFWDGNEREFGVDVDARLDPNILVQALAPVQIATNIIRRFRFNDLPPEGHVSVGAQLTDLSSFYIEIKAGGNDLSIDGISFTSVDLTQTYRNGMLRLNPLATRQGPDVIQGDVSIDFYQSLAFFNLMGHMDLADVEDLAYPAFKMFGHHIHTEGRSKIDAHGTLDWGSMRQTDFTVKIEAEQLALAVAPLDDFKATVIGDGPMITFTKASFGLFEGAGMGTFSMRWDPAQLGFPYEVDLSFAAVNFQKFFQFVRKNPGATISGELSGYMKVSADFSTNFFAVANGAGFVLVENGQLTDLPLFRGFSRLTRKIIPSFSIFSITQLQGNFTIQDGVISSENAYFDGDLVSAKARGTYTQETGFDAVVHAQMLSKKGIYKVVRMITDPLMKLFKMRLTGPLDDPSWKLENF